MNAPKLFLAAFVSLSFSLCSTSAIAAADAGQRTSPGTTLLEKKMVMLGEMRNMLSDCRQKYTYEMELLKMRYETVLYELAAKNIPERGQAMIGETDRVNAREQVFGEKAKQGYEYVQCVKAAKEHIYSRGGKVFVGYFKGKQQAMAKEAVAQWLTALDAVDKENFSTEVSKFEAASNAIKVDAIAN